MSRTVPAMDELFQLRCVILKMFQDRQYDISNKDLQLTEEQFYDNYQNEIEDRTMASLFINTMTMVVNMGSAEEGHVPYEDDNPVFTRQDEKYLEWEIERTVGSKSAAVLAATKIKKQKQREKLNKTKGKSKSTTTTAKKKVSKKIKKIDSSMLCDDDLLDINTDVKMKEDIDVKMKEDIDMLIFDTVIPEKDKDKDKKDKSKQTEDKVPTNPYKPTDSLNFTVPKHHMLVLVLKEFSFGIDSSRILTSIISRLQPMHLLIITPGAMSATATKEISLHCNVNKIDLQICSNKTIMAIATESSFFPGSVRLLSHGEVEELCFKCKVKLVQFPNRKTSDRLVQWIGAKSGQVLEIRYKSTMFSPEYYLIGNNK